MQTKPNYQKYTSQNNKELNTNIRHNENRLTANGSRIKKLESEHKRLFTAQLKLESKHLWNYLDSANITKSTFKGCRHDDFEEEAAAESTSSTPPPQ